jgi:WD40 repeat protein
VPCGAPASRWQRFLGKSTLEGAALLSNDSALQTGKIKQEEKLHEKEIRDMSIYKDGTHLATASVDKTVKLIDTQTLEVLKVYQTDRPANAVALSPIFDQVSLQALQDTAKTSSKSDFSSGFIGRGPASACTFRDGITAGMQGQHSWACERE